MKYLIVGLGNIGDEYRDTRHNIGFMILDAFAEASNITFTTERYGDVGRGRVKNKQVVLLKPSTYMNLSGNAVRYWLQKENIPIDHMLVVVDDIALPFGAIRIKARGSDAGHNGLKNIAAMLGTQAYPRLRFGVGNDFARGTQIDYVLGPFTPEERQHLPERIAVAVDAIRTDVLAGLDRAMCDFNNK
ncbi:MAG: aminoacyl-tRNA hydrolase [Bacteroidales bacterium]|nr:aminoacyl-tRNA hydrolase [Bacteroidales bacterium]MCD8394717.1 aminoacyl-tRNA hydrolase [Bacteroidales bacterium]